MRKQALSKVSPVSGSEVEEQAVQRMSGEVKKGGQIVSDRSHQDE